MKTVQFLFIFFLIGIVAGEWSTSKGPLTQVSEDEANELKKTCGSVKVRTGSKGREGGRRSMFERSKQLMAIGKEASTGQFPWIVVLML